MGRKSTSRQETNAERTSRMSDNKRRHRTRQKEYVADLERRVAETREQGVQVTKEVQFAAQRVARENAKLRDLLRRTGYTEDVIDAWVRADGCMRSVERPQLALASTPERSEQRVASAGGAQRGRTLEACNVSVKEREPVQVKTSGSVVQSLNDNSEVSPTQVSVAIRKTSLSPTRYPDSTEAPCKLVTLLAKNPSADITQVPLSAESANQTRQISNPEAYSPDGIECSAAYTMLMQYATSDEKLDRIATALESGCTPTAAGGCKVKSSVVWKTLDEECS